MSDDHRHDALSANLQALLQMQSQTADLHRLFLEGQEAAQATFRELIVRQQDLVGGKPLPAMATPPPAATTAAVVPVPVSVPVPAPPAPLAVAPAPADAPPTPAAEAPVAATPELAPALLDIVSERTGYPVEVLELDMDLDTDLGIDSIKRVEILSALQARLPGLPAPDPEALGQLRTLGEIVAFMEAGAPAPAAGVAAAPRSPAKAAAAVDAAGDGSVVTAALLEVVSEKTGYPVEVLELDMDLDTDLGIDSIKRVEILSALQARHPELPAPDPEQLAELRTLGSIVSFLYGAAEGAPVPAPASPAAPTPVEPVAAAPSAPAPQAPVSLFRAEVVSRPHAAEGSPLALPTTGVLCLVDSGAGDPLGQGLASALAARDCEVLRLAWDEVEGAALPASLSGLILLPPLSLQEGAEASLLAAALTILQRGRAGLVTGALLASVSRMDGLLGLAGTAAAASLGGGALAGLIKTAALEWPELQGRVLDLDPELAVPAGEILEALLAAGPLERGLGAEGLCTLELIETAVAAGGAALGPDDRILLTGGARGVTAAAGLALAESTGATLILLGRSPAPEAEPEFLAGLEDEGSLKRALLQQAGGSPGNGSLAAVEASYRELLRAREIRQNLARMQAAGSRVLYRSVDLRDAAALTSILAEVETEVGAPTAVVHGAGVLADALLEAKTAEELERVVSTKLGGWQALSAALGETPLKALAFFSSTTARLGRRGQADYAAANEALNKLAHLERKARPGTRVVSIGWGPWDGGMVTPALARLFAEEGVPLIPLELGARLLVEELQAPAGSAVETVVLGGPLAAGASTASGGDGAARMEGTRAFDLELKSGQPFLSDHVIAGQAVLPLALSAEWLAQAALHEQPGMDLLGLDELRLFRGVRLEAGEARALTLSFGAARAEQGGLRIPTLLGDGGQRPNLGTEVLLGEAPFGGMPEVTLAAGLPSATGVFPFPAEAFYRILFHGPALHAIEGVEAYSEQLIAARIHRAPAPAEWLEAPLRGSWITDPLALDAAFQLGILWSVAARGQACLPAKVATYRQRVRAFPEGMLLVGKVESLEGQTLTMAFDWLDEAGELLAWMRGAEMILDPALTEAFSRRTLTTDAASDGADRGRIDA